MKNYKLKQWYPSLNKDWVVGDMVIHLELLKGYYHVEGKGTTISNREVENNPDFWELIEEKEPLFVTEDGVEIYINNIELFAVNSTFITASDSNFDFEVCKKEG